MNRIPFAALASLIFAMAGVEAQEAPKPAANETIVSRLIATTYGAPNLHLVSSNGKIEPFTLPKGTEWGNGSINAGSNDPLESPDHTQIAYVQKGSLHIRMMREGKLVVLVVVSGYAHHELLMSGWSPDGSSLVYYLGPPQADDAPPSKVKEPKFFVYDLKARASREIKPNGALCGWLPNGEMVLYDSETGTLNSQALTPSPASKPLFREAKDFGQIVVSPDGKKIAAAVNKFGSPGTSQLVTVKLAEGKVTPLTESGGWAEYQWPQWSPSGNQIAWQRRVNEKDGMPESVIAINGRNLTKPARVSTHYWLTEKTLAVVELEAITVVDAKSGKELGRKTIGKKSK